MKPNYCQDYNLSKTKLIKKIINFNKKNKVNYYEDNHYNHTRDILALGISLISQNKKKIQVLDYGSNPLSLVNLTNKIKLNNIKFTIYDPFFKPNFKKPIIKNRIVDIEELKTFNELGFKFDSYDEFKNTLLFISK